jgi:hypothetical protein
LELPLARIGGLTTTVFAREATTVGTASEVYIAGVKSANGRLDLAKTLAKPAKRADYAPGEHGINFCAGYQATPGVQLYVRGYTVEGPLFEWQLILRRVFDAC